MAKGTRRLGTVLPYSTAKVSYPIAPRGMAQPNLPVTGACFDPDEKLLYLYKPARSRCPPAPCLRARVPRERLRREKGTVPICRNGPKGASHKWGLSPFPGITQLPLENRRGAT